MDNKKPLFKVEFEWKTKFSGSETWKWERIENYIFAINYKEIYEFISLASKDVDFRILNIIEIKYHYSKD